MSISRHRVVSDFPESHRLTSRLLHTHIIINDRQISIALVFLPWNCCVFVYISSEWDLALVLFYFEMIFFASNKIRRCLKFNLYLFLRSRVLSLGCPCLHTAHTHTINNRQHHWFVLWVLVSRVFCLFDLRMQWCDSFWFSRFVIANVCLLMWLSIDCIE